MSKYPISKEYGAFAHFRPPLYRPVLPLARLALAHADRVVQRDKHLLVAEERATNGTRLITIAPKDADGPLPCLVLYHGGGFALPASRWHFLLAARYAREVPCVVVMPDYRLAPKHPHPAALDDARDSLLWVLEHTEMLGIDRGRIAVCGDSAGGCLAASAAYLAKQKGIDLSFQMLIYPVLDRRMQTESMRRYPDTPMWNAVLNRRMWQWYLRGDAADFLSLPETELPAGMPPAYIETAEFDCLHDEGAAYARQLEASGAAVTLNETRGTMHGFELVRCPTTEEAIHSRLDFMRSVWR